MDRTAGAVLVILALFGIWLLNTGRLTTIANIVANGSNSLAPAAVAGPGTAATPGVMTKAACTDFLSADCAIAIGQIYKQASSGGGGGGGGSSLPGVILSAVSHIFGI